MADLDLAEANKIAKDKIEQASAFSKRNVLKIAAIIILIFLLAAGTYRIHSYFNAKSVERLQQEINDRNDIIRMNADSIHRNKILIEKITNDIAASKAATEKLKSNLKNQENENEKIDSIVTNTHIDYSYNVVFGYFNSKRTNNQKNNAE